MEEIIFIIMMIGCSRKDIQSALTSGGMHDITSKQN